MKLSVHVTLMTCTTCTYYYLLLIAYD